jgi:uncharacterized protein
VTGPKRIGSCGPWLSCFSLFFFCFLAFARPIQISQSSADASQARSTIVKRVGVSLESDSLAIEIEISSPAVPASNRITDPDRLVFDFAGCELEGGGRRIPINRGPVQAVRVSEYSVNPPVTRVVVDSKEPLDFQLKPLGNRIVIEIPFSDPAASVGAAHHAPTAEEKQPEPIAQPSKQPVEKIATPVRTSKTTAYTLMAKAKALTIGDLQPLEQKAEAGDPEAETTLALAYHSAILLNRDEAEALRLLHKAADQGFMAAEESLGLFAETGVGTKQPAPAEAMEWFKKAVEHGSLDAATNIALMYGDGKGIPRDHAQAVVWFRRAAEGGDATAQYNLALIYQRGDGVPKDSKESARWLTAAADQNVLPAMLDLAGSYMHPGNAAAADVKRAMEYYEKAAELGSGVAQVILGNAFADGLAGKVDYQQAAKWYRKAGEQGQPDGQFELGVLYLQGEGVTADLEEARRWFTAAADQGQADAQYSLAAMYDDGKGGVEDRELAMHYYQLAAEQGVIQAQFRYGLSLARHKESRTDRVAAYKWLMLAQASITQSTAALNDLRRSMDEQEVREAERSVDEWRMAHRNAQR